LLVSLNGKILKSNKALALIKEPGFLYGYGLFETMRSYHGKIPFLENHLKRLISSSEIIDLNAPTISQLRRDIYRVLKVSNARDAYIRLNVWQGKKTNTAVMVKKFIPYKQAIYEKGFQGIIVNYRQNEFSPLSRIKSLNYLLLFLARREAESQSTDEAILLNTQGYLAEGSRSNIFLVKNKKIFTPSSDCGCLAGIIRKIVIELARKEGLRVFEQKIPPKDLFNADEAFLTNSLIEVMPLSKVNRRNIGSGQRGGISALLLDRYQELISQILE
jgi:branched-chain amino acid aminotransferase